MNLFSYFTSFKPFILAFRQSDFIGKMIMLALIALSLICWLIILKKSKEFKTLQNERKIILDETLKLKNPLANYEPKISEAPFAKLYTSFRAKALDILNKNRFFIGDDTKPVYLSETDLNMVEQNGLLSITESIQIIEKNVPVLSTIATLAPFLGLLGTVWGILVTFSELSSGAQAAQNSAVIGGLSMALATTVMGLVIAIPALISYNRFRQELKEIHIDMDAYLGKLILQLELQYRKASL